jgi:hypothetical protein
MEEDWRSCVRKNSLPVRSQTGNGKRLVSEDGTNKSEEWYGWLILML